MKLYRNRFYLVESVPGISGFKQWDKREFRLVTGLKARLHRNDVVCEYVLGHGKPDQFRIENGRLPEYQPVVSAKEALAYLATEPFGSLFAIPT